MFQNGFPSAIIQDEYQKVLPLIGTEQYGRVTVGFSHAYNSESEHYILASGETVFFPYRIYYRDNDLCFSQIADVKSKLVYDCMFTRSCDGFVREKHLKQILSSDYPEWCMPYILRLASEYVYEIIEDIYESMKSQDNSAFQTFCRNNPVLLKRAYTRMTSYWNEFYRSDYYRFSNYIGAKLFREYFCPYTNFEKL